MWFADLPEWFRDAECFRRCRDGEASPDWWFPSGKARHRWTHAAEVCRACPIAAECLTWAININKQPGHLTMRVSGVWGGRFFALTASPSRQGVS